LAQRVVGAWGDGNAHPAMTRDELIHTLRVRPPSRSARLTATRSSVRGRRATRALDRLVL